MAQQKVQSSHLEDSARILGLLAVLANCDITSRSFSSCSIGDVCLGHLLMQEELIESEQDGKRCLDTLQTHHTIAYRHCLQNTISCYKAELTTVFCRRRIARCEKVERLRKFLRNNLPLRLSTTVETLGEDDQSPQSSSDFDFKTAGFRIQRHTSMGV